jgi:hypothetical protein
MYAKSGEEGTIHKKTAYLSGGRQDGSLRGNVLYYLQNEAESEQI